MNPIRTIIVTFFISAFAFGAIAFSRAEGISCGRASDNVEAAICATPSLSEQDAELAEAYRAAMQRVGGRRSELLVSQLQFIDERKSCARTDCIYSVTQTRIGELKRWR